MSCIADGQPGVTNGKVDFPHKLNGTIICGINPYYPSSILEKCCAGPITNITSPTPKDGPLSDSWPVHCLAFCPVVLKAKLDYSDTQANRRFADCMHDSFDAAGVSGWEIVCTGIDSPGPYECIPFRETPGCTDRYSPSTWGSTGYLPYTPTTAHDSKAGQAESTATQDADDSDSGTPRVSMSVSKVLTGVFLLLVLVV